MQKLYEFDYSWYFWPSHVRGWFGKECSETVERHDLSIKGLYFRVITVFADFLGRDTLNDLQPRSGFSNGWRYFISDF